MAMLDDKRYYSAFPDENPAIRLRGLLDALERLEKEFRQKIEHFRVKTAQPDVNNNPEA